MVEEREHELISFAQQEGIAWAKYSLTLAFKLEWVHAIRRTLWDFLYNYDLLSDAEINRNKFYTMEKNVNELMDLFLTNFFISFSKFKDELIDRQRKLVENLSVPIIPINNNTCILPLIGSIDFQRMATIEDKVLLEIENENIQKLIIDLSGVVTMEDDHIKHLSKITQGINMMGCETILTGLRADIVKKLINSDHDFTNLKEFKGTLQSALNDAIFSNID